MLRLIQHIDPIKSQSHAQETTYRIWSEREKQIWVVQENLNALFGDIKGIAGNSLNAGEIMELAEPEID